MIISLQKQLGIKLPAELVLILTQLTECTGFLEQLVLFSATWYMTGNHIHSIVLDLCEKDTLYLRNAWLRCLPLSNQRDDTQCLSETEREEKHHGPSPSARWRSKGLPQPRDQNNSSTIAVRTENIATSAKQIWSQCQMLKACEIILKWEQRGETTANKCDGVNKL